MNERPRHKVVRTEVWKTKNTSYGVLFEFDDGAASCGEAGTKDTAEFYARVQVGQTFPVGVNPMLLNAAKADQLKRN